MTGPAVEVERLTVSFERWGQRTVALEDVSLRVAVGEWVTIVGPNGSGKSTLLHALAGDLRPASGEVRIGGDEASGASARRRIALVPQDPTAATVGELTLGEHFAVARRDLGRLEVHNRASAAITPYGLGERLDQELRFCSGGERQLITLLLARERQASIILCDEPFAALDPARVEQCLGILLEMNKAGRTIVLVSHDRNLVARLARRVVSLESGRIRSDEIEPVTTNRKPSAHGAQ